MRRGRNICDTFGWPVGEVERRSWEVGWSWGGLEVVEGMRGYEFGRWEGAVGTWWERGDLKGGWRGW